MNYREELVKSMNWLGEQENSFFLGQSICWPGTALYSTLESVPSYKKREMPIMEESQLSMSLGLSLAGFVPINIIPRYNFLLLAVNSLYNHICHYKDISDGQYIPKIIVRTVKGSEKPLFPGRQHVGSFSAAFRALSDNIEVIDLTEPEQIFESYQKAFLREDGRSTILVEDGDLIK